MAVKKFKETDISSVVSEFYRSKMAFYKKLLLLLIFVILMVFIGISFFNVISMPLVLISVALVWAALYQLERFSVRRGNDRVVSDELLAFIAAHEKLDVQYKEQLGKYIEREGEAVSFKTLSSIDFTVMKLNRQNERKAGVGASALVDIAKNSEKGQ